MKRIPLRNRFKEIIAYALVDDEDFDWLNQSRWCLSSHGYAIRNVPTPERGIIGRHIAMHRELLDLKFGDPRQGDHVNRDRLDNRRCNLRVATHAENMQNTKGEISLDLSLSRRFVQIFYCSMGSPSPTQRKEILAGHLHG